MTPMEVQKKLLALRDGAYREFHVNLIPTVSQAAIIGIRTPALRALAKELNRAGEQEPFLRDLPHRYYDENNLHAFLICEIRDFDRCMAELEAFLPYVDNWATCDALRPKVLRKDPNRLLMAIRRWMASEQPFIVRFGMEMLMLHFLDDRFQPEYLELAASVHSEEYYVKMMTAWFFAEALAKQYTASVPYVERHRLETWTHRMTIRKACESFRVSAERKEYLKTLR